MTDAETVDKGNKPADITSVNESAPTLNSDVEPTAKLDENSTAFDSSDDEFGAPVFTTRKRIKKFSDSESDAQDEKESTGAYGSEDDNIKENTIMIRNGRSRMRRIAVTGDEDSNSGSPIISKALSSDDNSNDHDFEALIKSKTKSQIFGASKDSDDNDSLVSSKNEEQQLRMKNKRNKMKNKFKDLLTSRGRDTLNKKEKKEDEDQLNGNVSGSENTDEEISSIDKIKQKIKERNASLKKSICDPDTSDEETETLKKVNKPKKDLKRTKMISPKPQRMSAKEAMENMQKIKSESNRMLREREVSLPYHRPKALSLQDIMKRRRPAVSSDGKVLPIKMNEEQLKQYALSLEQRQKEMIELCKSESEEDEESDEKKDVENTISSNIPSNGDTVVKDVSLIPKLCSETNTENTSVDKDVIINEDDAYHSDTVALKEAVVDDNLMVTKAPPDSENRPEIDSCNKSGDISAEMELVYNDSVEEKDTLDDTSKDENIDYNKADKQENDIVPITTTTNENSSNTSNEKMVTETAIDNVELLEQPNKTAHNTEVESQLICLYYDSEKTENVQLNTKNQVTEDKMESNRCSETKNTFVDNLDTDGFPEDDDLDMNDIDMENIDSIIENTKISQDINTSVMDSPALVRDIPALNVKPKLTGAPGMVIDLDGGNPSASKRLTGVELLKERFSFFAGLKTPEEKERDREKRQKPGTQHLKLKQELENIIAEQRSLEWSKRLEGEKQQQMDIDAEKGDESDAEDDIDKIEAKLDDEPEKEPSSESEEEEDLLEDDVLIEDKPLKKNPLVADEAEESDVDDAKENCDDNDIDGSNNEDDDGENEDDEDSSSEDESSESENEGEAKPKKGRILKAFEDSDDEPESELNEKDLIVRANKSNDTNKPDDIESEKILPSQNSDGIIDSQDDVIQLAQVTKQLSSDVFTSQGNASKNSEGNAQNNNSKDEEDLGTQTFSIMSSNQIVKDVDDPDKLTTIISDDSDKLNVGSGDSDKLLVISETQPYSDDNLDAVVGMCSGSFQTQNCIEIQPSSMQTQMSQSQAIGEDLLDMCTGKFYDNQFVSPNEDKMNTSDDLSQVQTLTTKIQGSVSDKRENASEKQKHEGDILRSVLEELNEPDSTKPLKFFCDAKQNKENEPNIPNTQAKKRFVIESDDETNDNTEVNKIKNKSKKLKKKKIEKRALQISDDEEEFDESEEGEDNYLSENEGGIEDDNEEERLVEYDSEENEVEVKPQIVKKKKKKASEFFEQEAELTSEDEWVGSGDEDEAGLDRMEREAGDDETFHQGKLQRELGQIHMRDVLDQDKREVRLIQELLFEDGDLGGGGRQRKFRWRNADGDDETGTVPNELADTQEEEFESEEQWRKQRHEREMFLRQMKNEKEDDLDVSVNRTSIIKANLCSRTMSSLLEEVNQSKTEPPKTTAPPEKKTAKDIPSPAKKPFMMFQQNYHGSLLTRGQGALARLAALATPLAADDDAPKVGLLAPSAKRNFVFAALTPEPEPKVTKRKAESNVGTPRLVKKMKTEEKQSRPKSSLLEFLKS